MNFTTPAPVSAAPTAALPFVVAWRDAGADAASSPTRLFITQRDPASGYPRLDMVSPGSADSFRCLTGAQVAAQADARSAVDELRAAFAGLHAHDLTSVPDMQLPAPGELRLSDGSGAHSLQLDSSNPRVGAFVDAVRGAAAVLAHAG